MPQISFYCNHLLVTVMIPLSISLNWGLPLWDFKPRKKSTDLFSLRLSSEGLWGMFWSVLLLKILLVYFSTDYVHCDILYCQVKSNYSCLSLVLACVSTDEWPTGCTQIKRKKKSFSNPTLICFLFSYGKNTFSFLTKHLLHISRCPIIYSRIFHIRLYALWSAQVFLHSV